MIYFTFSIRWVLSVDNLLMDYVWEDYLLGLSQLSLKNSSSMCLKELFYEENLFYIFDESNFDLTFIILS